MASFTDDLKPQDVDCFLWRLLYSLLTCVQVDGLHCANVLPGMDSRRILLENGPESMHWIQLWTGWYLSRSPQQCDKVGDCGGG
jgi:hypothetical protein